jgi:lysophospholipase L1-like esterase
MTRPETPPVRQLTGQRSMSRRKKLLIGLATAAMVFAGLELAARVYSRFRYGNPVAIQYGFNFLGKLAAGTVSLDFGWGAGRGGDDVEQHREAAEGLAVQELFDRRNNPDDGLVLRKPAVVSFNGGHSATVNSLGFRGPDYSREIPAGRHRIVVVGGSYVFGAYLRDDQTWAHLLEKGLRAKGVDVEVVNGGNAGANVHGALSDLIRISNRINLNTAVITTGYNNHPLLPIRRRYTVVRRLDYYLYNLSLFYVTMKERLARVIDQPLDYGLYRQSVEVNAADVDWLIAIYKKRLDQIATLCEERAIRVVFASEGERFFQTNLNEQSSQTAAILEAMGNRVRTDHQLTMAELEYYLQGRLNTAAREVAESRGAPFFDGEAVLMQDKLRNFADQIHPNEIGSARLAKGLEEFLLPIVTRRATAASAP